MITDIIEQLFIVAFDQAWENHGTSNQHFTVLAEFDDFLMFAPVPPQPSLEELATMF